METLYKEMQERLRYLEAQEENDENRYRIMELTLAIVRTQQLLLANVSGMFCTCGTKSNELDVNGRCETCGKKLDVMQNYR